MCGSIVKNYAALHSVGYITERFIHSPVLQIRDVILNDEVKVFSNLLAVVKVLVPFSF